MVVRQKAFAYITNVKRLLVFEHPDHPDAGIQAPAGTIEIGEEPADAALREAFEETGLDGLKLAAFLGTCERDMSDTGVNEIHRRWFYHLLSEGEHPDSWVHFESHPSSGEQTPIEFRLYWVQFPAAFRILLSAMDRCWMSWLSSWREPADVSNS